MSPFEVVYGFNPLTPTDLLPLPRNEYLNTNGRDRAKRIKDLHEDARKSLEKATEVYARYANRGRKELILQPGDWVWLHMRKERFPAKRRNKLSPRGDGPFRVLERINNNAYKIELPEDYGINPTFNVADLKLYERGDEDEEVRLMDQPLQGGGNDTEVESQSLIQIRLREGPTSRKQIKAFRNKVQTLLRNWEDHPEDKFKEISDSTMKISNFKKWMHGEAQNKVWKTCLALEEPPPGADI